MAPEASLIFYSNFVLMLRYIKGKQRLNFWRSDVNIQRKFNAACNEKQKCYHIFTATLR